VSTDQASRSLGRGHRPFGIKTCCNHFGPAAEIERAVHHRPGYTSRDGTIGIRLLTIPDMGRTLSSRASIPSLSSISTILEEFTIGPASLAPPSKGVSSARLRHNTRRQLRTGYQFRRTKLAHTSQLRMFHASTVSLLMRIQRSPLSRSNHSRFSAQLCERCAIVYLNNSSSVMAFQERGMTTKFPPSWIRSAR